MAGHALNPLPFLLLLAAIHALSYLFDLCCRSFHSSHFVIRPHSYPDPLHCLFRHHYCVVYPTVGLGLGAFSSFDY